MGKMADAIKGKDELHARARPMMDEPMPAPTHNEPMHPEPMVTRSDILDAPAGEEAHPAYTAANPPPAITSPMGPVEEESPTATPDEPQELGADGIPVSALEKAAEAREAMREGTFDYSVGDPAQEK